MGYLVDQMEKLAKESERSFGDKLALGAGAGAGYMGANAAMNTAALHALGSDEAIRNITNRAGISTANDIGIRKALKGFGDKISRGMAFNKQLGDEALEQFGKAYNVSKGFGNGALRAGFDGYRAGMSHAWKALPKKVKLLAALGLPVAGAATYGGYKAADSLID
jgi:hypothetical protein